MSEFGGFFDSKAPEIALKSLFWKYDKDGSGDLSQAELKILFIDDLGLTEDEAKTYSLLLDIDGSNSVSFDEFRKWLRSGERFQIISNAGRSRYRKLLHAIEVFQKYDLDGNQALSREEFKKMYLEYFHKSPDRVDSVIAKLDKDGNGSISFLEFLNYLKWEPLDRV